MQIAQVVLDSPAFEPVALAPLQAVAPQLVLAFGATSFFSGDAGARISAALPGAKVVGCSTAGEIGPGGVADGTMVLAAVHFDAVRVLATSTDLASMADSRDAGERIGAALAGPDLAAVLVLGPGLAINGSDLVEGITARLGTAAPITGGLAGDGGAFQRTWTLGPDGCSDHRVVAVGLCGDRLEFGHGSFGGWKPFGPLRKVTRCDGNVLYELDGQPALEVYERYLGEYARDLPASGLLFPFAMIGKQREDVGLIRTILGIDREAGSLTLAGSIDADGDLMLMHSNTDSLVDGAEAAAEAARLMQSIPGPSLAILVSCVGRKLVMGDRVDEEVEAVGQVFGAQATLTGFYSYGEISPFTKGTSCQLHNQTMTVTWIGER
jgi:hypothetical protein